MTGRLPGKYEPNLHTMPWFFGGRVPEIKYSYTVAGLTPSPYPIRVRSIARNNVMDTHSTKSKYLNAETDAVNPIVPKEFKECAFLKESEVLVTIEHCDNCHEHANTTRHDPVKYYQLAQIIKNAILSRYSMVKILIKPVSKLDSENNKKRLGAFEVQVSTKSKGSLKVAVLHSKLSTGRWPDISEVITKLSSYLPTCQLFITVFDELNQEKPLKGLKVGIRPKPVELDNPRPSSHYSTVRPKSSVTTRSLKSMRVMSKRRMSYKSIKKCVPGILYERITDRDGTCLFENIPLDVYEIVVEETKEFKESVKVYNTFEEKLKNSSLNVYIGMKSIENSNITVVLRDPLLKDQVSNAKVFLIKDSEILPLKETKRGAYEISVPKNEYLLTISADKYKDVSKTIIANEPELLINENLELKKSKEIFIFTFNALTGAEVSGVIIQIQVNNHISLEGQTKTGKCSFKVDEVGSFLIKCRMKGYIKAKLLINIGNENTKNVFVPLVASSTTHPVLTISSCESSDNFEVQAMSTNPLNFQNSQIEGFLLNDLLKTHGFASISIVAGNKDLRVAIKGLTKELCSLNGFIYSGISFQYYSWQKNISSIKPVHGIGD